MLALPILLWSCAIDFEPVFWANPISDIQKAPVDECLIATWVMKDIKDKVYVHIGKGDKNRIRFVYQENGDEFSTRGDLYVSKLDKRRFLNIDLDLFRCIPKQPFQAYMTAEYEMKGEDNLIVRLPDDGFLKTAIQNKRLTGAIESNSILVIDDSSAIRLFIRNSPKDKLFSNILRFKRLKGF